MRVGMMGFGKTGKAVATILLKNPGAKLEWVIRKSEKLEHRSVPEFLGIESGEPGLIYSVNEFSINEMLDKNPVDVVIDFSSEGGLDYYGDEAANRNINIVTAISHYSMVKQHKLQQLSNQTAVLWSPNITVGINFLILTAQILRQIAPSVDVEIIEEHFKVKKEISGTAKIISKSLGVEESEIKSIRAGGIIGVHEILFGFPFETVRLRHESITREAFGNGAMFAAEKLKGMKPGLYKMEDLLLPYFGDDKERQKITILDRLKDIVNSKFRRQRLR